MLTKLLAAATITITLAIGASAAHSTPNYDWPGMKKCGTFDAGLTIWVYAQHVSCSTARRIQKEYWLGPKSRKIVHNGGSGAAGWVKLKRYPGWTCYSGSGGGSCERGKKVAGYQN